MAMVWVILCILILVVCILLIKNYLIKRQIKSITKQLEEQKEQFVSIDLVDKDLETMTVKLNEMICSIQSIRVEARKEGENIKSSISMLSHDMRTPLTSVIGYLQLAEQSCKQKEVLTNLQIALERAGYCNKLVNDLFELSVIDSNTYEPVIEKVNLCEVVCEEILANYPGFEKKGITPVFEQAEECAWVQADRQLLLRVIQNLISNSIKYTTGTVNFFVTKEEKVSLIITSSVSKEINVEKIFEKFYQEDHSRKSKGIGLGLYICKKFMEDMNGRISAENKDGMFVIKIELEHF